MRVTSKKSSDDSKPELARLRCLFGLETSEKTEKVLTGNYPDRGGECGASLAQHQVGGVARPCGSLPPLSTPG